MERERRELRPGKPASDFDGIDLRLYSASETDPAPSYTGSTTNLRDRLRRRNDGRVPYTPKWKPWKVKTYIAMSDGERATKLEDYLKSHSGRAL